MLNFLYLFLRKFRMKCEKNDISYILAVFYYHLYRIFIGVNVILFGNWFRVVYFHSPMFFIAIGHTTKPMMHDVHCAPF